MSLFLFIMVAAIYILLCLIWGSTWLAIKIGLDDAPPFWSAGFRFLMAALAVTAISFVRRVRYPRSLKEIALIAVPGIFMYAASYMAVYKGESYIDSSLTAVTFAVFPFFVAGFSCFWLREERLRFKGWLGLILGLLGTTAIFYDSLLDSRFALWGMVLVLLGAMASAFATVFVRARLRTHDITVMASIQMALGAGIILTVAAFFEPIGAFKMTFKSIAALLYLAVFGTVIGFLGYYWLLKKMKAITVAQLTFITPIIAILLGYFFRTEKLSMTAGFGAVMILGGVMLVLRD